MNHDNVAVMHVTQSYDGGVRDVINTLANLEGSFAHYILYSGGAECPPKSFTHVAQFSGRGILANIAQLRAMVAVLKPDVVHAHSSFAGLICRLARLNAPVIYQPHGVAFTRPDFSASLRWLTFFVERALAGKAEMLVAVSENERLDLGRLKSSSPVVILENLSSLEGLTLKKPVAKRRAFAVAMSGRITSVKSPETLIEIRHLLSDEVDDFRFIWIGDGEPLLKSQLAEGGVEVTGWLDKIKLYDLLNNIDVYVHTSVSEGFPLAILDAAYCGLPILVRNIKAFEFTSFEKFDSAKEAAQKLLILKHDRSFFEELCLRTTRLSATHSPNVIREKYADLVGVAIQKWASKHG